MPTETWGLIVAAGKGRRLGGETPKPYLSLNGRPLLGWALEAFQRCHLVDAVQLVVASERIEQARELVRQLGLDKVRGVAAGGATRPGSVQRGLAALPAACGLVAIHDGARPLVRPSLIGRVVAAAAESGAAIPALAVRDTVKRGEGGAVAATVDRAGLHLAQTPQVFAVELIRRAHAEASGADGITDDAQLVERLGHTVSLVAGDPDNLKVTLPGDLDLAERLLSSSGGAALRVGTGYDAHRLVAGRRLVLGGVEIDHPLGLLGHSDADVLSHAVGDALLGAAALGDLGRHFPADDPALRGVSSLVLLERIVAKLRAAGHRPASVDATLLCQAPRLAPHVDRMRGNLARALAMDLDRVNIKATTTEGLGFVGRGEGIAAQAVALLVPLTNR